MKKEIIIKHWQQHTLTVPIETIRQELPECRLDKMLVFTGTVVSDSSGKFQVGWHCRSTPAINYDKEAGRVETRNSIYHLKGGPGDMFGELGDGVLNIFYSRDLKEWMFTASVDIPYSRIQNME